jgi:hypothetical protein
MLRRLLSTARRGEAAPVPPSNGVHTSPWVVRLAASSFLGVGLFATYVSLPKDVREDLADVTGFSSMRLLECAWEAERDKAELVGKAVALGGAATLMRLVGPLPAQLHSKVCTTASEILDRLPSDPALSRRARADLLSWAAQGGGRVAQRALQWARPDSTGLLDLWVEQCTLADGVVPRSSLWSWMSAEIRRYRVEFHQDELDTQAMWVWKNLLEDEHMLRYAVERSVGASLRRADQGPPPPRLERDHSQHPRRLAAQHERAGIIAEMVQTLVLAHRDVVDLPLPSAVLCALLLEAGASEDVTSPLAQLRTQRQADSTEAAVAVCLLEECLSCGTTDWRALARAAPLARPVLLGSTARSIARNNRALETVQDGVQEACEALVQRALVLSNSEAAVCSQLVQAALSVSALLPESGQRHTLLPLVPLIDRVLLSGDTSSWTRVRSSLQRLETPLHQSVLLASLVRGLGATVGGTRNKVMVAALKKFPLLEACTGETLSATDMLEQQRAYQESVSKRLRLTKVGLFDSPKFWTVALRSLALGLSDTYLSPDEATDLSHVVHHLGIVPVLFRLLEAHISPQTAEMCMRAIANALISAPAEIPAAVASIEHSEALARFATSSNPHLRCQAIRTLANAGLELRLGEGDKPGAVVSKAARDNPQYDEFLYPMVDFAPDGTIQPLQEVWEHVSPPDSMVGSLQRSLGESNERLKPNAWWDAARRARPEVECSDNQQTQGEPIDLVFVHGIDGSGLTTWRSSPTPLPLLELRTGNEGMKQLRKSLRSMNGGMPPHLATVASSESDSRSLWPIAWLAPLLLLESGICARVLAVEYDAGSRASMSAKDDIPIDATASAVARSLHRARVGANGRPVVFVTHSMGGLLIKCVLLKRAGQGRGAGWINGPVSMLFLGTPHRGSPVADLAETLETLPGVLTASPALRRLKTNHPFLLSLNDQFLELVLRSREEEATGVPFRVDQVHSVAEGQDWPLPPPIHGIRVVPPESADPGIGSFRIDHSSDHLTVNKPPRPDASLMQLAHSTARAAVIAAASHRNLRHQLMVQASHAHKRDD